MEAFAVPGLPEFEAGDDVATAIESACDLREDDVVCVASTIVSKVEGRTAALADYPAGPRAREIAARFEAQTGDERDPRFAQAVLEESTDLVMDEPFLLTETRFGHVGVNAGIDRSNTGGAELLLLPKRPSESAERIREALSVDVPVVVTDTSGRPFRHGQAGVAIGWAGMPASRDWRGETDRDGHELEVTVESVVDELAATANLVSGEGDDGTPVVVVRDWTFGDHEGSENLYRDLESDFVRQALREWSYEEA
ncbi:coenzyme F420-0:L-glutamate ligase [Halarchaeum salinum]|uniref:Coenzyme F420:L-glutamate ligase n=1 Tax=Halarchaeum salinum TaxID=489912 RepID=A0AAV3S5R3_9EURY